MKFFYSDAGVGHPVLHRNDFVGKSINGNPNYAQLKGKEITLLPLGLTGPVRILV